MRLDKFLSNMGVGTRSEVKQLLKQNAVEVNNKKKNKANDKLIRIQISLQSMENK